MGFNCGIVGLPNVGKSTLFNALTKAQIDAANFPFCTIEPNTGVVPVPDPRLDALAAIVNPERVMPTTMEFVDIAGLVRGASKGEGLGNQFLANIRETDAIAHVVRCFEDENVVHVDGRIDAIADVEVINTELALADLETVQRASDRVRRRANVGEKEARDAHQVLERLEAHLDTGAPARLLELPREVFNDVVRPLNLLTVKPTLYIANVPEDGGAGNEHVARLTEIANAENAGVVVVCNKLEAEIAELDDEEKADFLADLGVDEPGLNRVIRAGYALLDLLTFFTAGPKEARAWTVSRGATAPQAAGRIHTDFEKGFIRAEVVAYDDYVAGNGEAGAKDAGRWRLEGKDYVMQDGDVVHFRFNV